MATGSRARKWAEVLKNQGEVLKNGARRSKTSHRELGAAGDGQGHGPSLRGQGQQPAMEPGCSQLGGSAGFASQLPDIWGQGRARESPPHARVLPGGLHRPLSPAAQPGLAGGLQAQHIKAAAGERLSHSASPARRAPCPRGRQAGSSRLLQGQAWLEKAAARGDGGQSWVWAASARLQPPSRGFQCCAEQEGDGRSQLVVTLPVPKQGNAPRGSPWLSITLCTTSSSPTM